MRILLPIFIAFGSLFALSDDYNAGKVLYFEKGCNGCHGTKAEGMTNYPALANRAKGFLAYKLRRFRSEISDKQIQEMMIPFAKGLSDKEIDQLTTFLNEYVDEQTERYDIEFTTEGDGGS
ncbi:cytochrome c [Sulfurimonas sp. HSL3-7]|uniref:c-type cytochrome n=1 Tax=Sulfonitrofixus jiaomeiensis TaxID=3131938 RepID=UPI0031F7801D